MRHALETEGICLFKSSESLNVHIIKSSAYGLQTQGKDERSHKTWEEKIKYDIVIKVAILTRWSTFLNIKDFTMNLAQPPGIFNSIHFGCLPNRMKNSLFLGEKKKF